MSVNSIGQVRNQARQYLARLASADYEADLLLCHLLQCSRSYLITHAEQSLEPELVRQYLNLSQRRAEGVPLAYLTGWQAFWQHQFAVTADVLIPRPETELLVELALAKLNYPNAQVLELGTGSGAIAISLALARPEWQLTAIDNSQAALVVAQTNAQQLNATNIKFLHSNWLKQLGKQKFNAIISNPPYVSEAEYQSEASIQAEPKAALVAADQGLAELASIIRNSPEHLLADGYLMLEHGHRQAAQVQGLLSQAGFSNIETWPDLAGHDRVTLAQI